MKNKFTRLFLVLTTATAVLSCSNDEDTDKVDETLNEYKYIRLLVSDENTTALTLFNPFSNSTSSFEAKHPKSALYTSESGRLGAIIHREFDYTETFDTGLEFHGDHVDVKGTPKFGAMTSTSAKPTHFKSKIGEIMTFNDGDGTLSVGKESDVHTPGAKMTIINAGLKEHHGAMATFSNGNYAITEKDNSIPGVLPERVKIIDRTGKELYASTIATKGIHGNATDGTYAVFGSASGILVVQSNGTQELIPHPANFGTVWFGTILETSTKGNFIGFAATKGVYLINVVKKTVSPIIENTDIMQCKTSFDGNQLGILLHSGNFISYNLNTLAISKESTNLIPATAKDSKQKPQMVFTNRFVYITQPSSGEIAQFLIKNTSNNKKVKVSNTPYRLTLLGFENSVDH
jgi:hypothetical protein